jgi:hypothetical protein
MKDNKTKLSSDKKSMGTFNKVGNAVERQKNREHKFAKKTYSAASKNAQKIKEGSVKLGTKTKKAVKARSKKISTGFKNVKAKAGKKYVSTKKTISEKYVSTKKTLSKPFTTDVDALTPEEKDKYYKKQQDYEEKKKRILEKRTKMKNRVLETNFVKAIINDVTWLRNQLPKFDNITQAFDYEKLKEKVKGKEIKNE